MRNLFRATKKWNRIFDGYESKVAKKIIRIELQTAYLGDGNGPAIYVRRIYKRKFGVRPDGYFIDPADLLYRVNVWKRNGINFNWKSQKKV